MNKTTAAQKRLFENAVLIVATGILFNKMRSHFPCPPLDKLVTIHNGKGLPAAKRDATGEFEVYAAGGLVGRHSARLSDTPFVVIGRKGSAGKPTYAPHGGWVIDTAYYAQSSDKTQLDCKFLFYALSSLDFTSDIISTAIPGINRTSIYRYTIPVPPKDVQEACVRFLDTAAERSSREFPFLPPPLSEQRRMVARVEELAAAIGEVQHLQNESMALRHHFLQSIYMEITRGVACQPMAEVAPLVRRPVRVNLEDEYPELGVRSFGNRTFHKPAMTGAELGSKRIFKIEADDLLFNIVFAWEGAVAVGKPEDHGRYGSHRFLTCVPKVGVATSSFLCFHFLTEHGLEQLGEASPGGAGRNRTLGLKALADILVPIPPYDKQVWFDTLQNKLVLHPVIIFICNACRVFDLRFVLRRSS